MDLNQQFEQAVANSKDLSEKPSNETLLNLYALYKQATSGDAPAEFEGNMFDFVAKAKWDAWKEINGKSQLSAQQDYIDLVEKLKSE
jgi:diazepam-binding inhibitor (GABA receptor modulator, acyl-CoA-binding protein)